jgi:hypothetical protein
MIPSLELIRLAVEIGVATPNRHEDAEPDARCDLHIIEINQARASSQAHAGLALFFLTHHWAR